MKEPHPPELRTLPAMLAHHAAVDPDRQLLRDKAGVLTRGEAITMARGMQAAFEALGVTKGDTVAVMADNRREFVECWFGLAFAGAVEVPVKPANVGQRLVHVFNHSQSRLAVVQADYLPQLDRVADELTHLERIVVIGAGASERFTTIAYGELARDADAASDAEVRFSDPVAVLYTSGSTGPAKGALVSHGQHYMNGYQPTATFDLGEDDRLFVCLPLDHNMAQGYGVMPAVVSGGSVHLVPRFDAATFWDDIRTHDCTVLPFVGALLVLLAKQPARPDDADNPIRAAYGIPIPTRIHEDFEQRFGLTLTHLYGSTEATIVTWNHGPDRVVGACGQPFDGYELQIVDEHDRPLATGEAGQICIRAREPFGMFSGYFRDPQRTVEAFRNLWFHTGDQGRFDERGNLWFIDRVGDVIRRMGENISSYEVEQAIVGHPDVQLAAAYGVPSELIEEEVMVSVVPRTGADLDPAALRAWCIERLPRYAIPRFVRIVDELPLTPTGKHQKHVLKRIGTDETTYDARAERQER